MLVLLLTCCRHDVMLNFEASIKYFNYLLSRVPTDPGAISHLGRVCSKNDDETQAYHFHHEVRPS